MIADSVHRKLPSHAQQVADVIGQDRLLHLVSCWKRTSSGGPDQLCMYVPEVLTPDHRLVSVLGWADASKLVKAFKREILYLPYCSSVFKSWRNQAIRRLAREANMKAPELSEWFDISERQVRNVLKEISLEATIH